MFLISACSCLCAIYWSQVLSGEWRCNWSSTDRRCFIYIWVTNNLIAYQSALILETWRYVKPDQSVDELINIWTNDGLVNWHICHSTWNVQWDIPWNLWYKGSLVGFKCLQGSSWCSWSIAYQHCSNYIFILDLTPRINGLGEDNCKARRETFKFWDLRFGVPYIRDLTSLFYIAAGSGSREASPGHNTSATMSSSVLAPPSQLPAGLTTPVSAPGALPPHLASPGALPPNLTSSPGNLPPTGGFVPNTGVVRASPPRVRTLLIDHWEIYLSFYQCYFED